MRPAVLAPWTAHLAVSMAIDQRRPCQICQLTPDRASTISESSEWIGIGRQVLGRHYGHRPFRTEVPAHVLCAGGADPVSRHHRNPGMMPTNIFPEINIPVVTVIWSYTGCRARPRWSSASPLTAGTSISSNVNGIRNMEAQTLNGLSVQKIYFQSDVNLDLAIAQIVSATNSNARPALTRAGSQSGTPTSDDRPGRWSDHCAHVPGHD